ncbi:hypothetical protein [Parabacteroides goldsteinii]
MKTDESNNRHLIADEGKVLRRISDGWIAGEEIYLGYTYYLDGELLPEPLLEQPEHYEEVDKVILEETPDEAFDTEAEVLIDPKTSLMSLPEPVSEPLEPTQVRLTELLATALNEIEVLKKEVAELKK